MRVSVIRIASDLEVNAKLAILIDLWTSQELQFQLIETSESPLLGRGEELVAVFSVNLSTDLSYVTMSGD